jgi:hypothetical protein
MKRKPRVGDGAVVETASYLDAFDACQEVVDLHTIARLNGPPGTGKTEAVRQFCAICGFRPLWVHLESSQGGYAVTRLLHRQLHIAGTGSGDDLLERLTPELVNPHRLIVVDESDLMRRDSLRHVTYLSDREDLAVGFVLIGSDFTEAEALAPQLFNRVTCEVPFRALGARELIPVIRAYHPELLRPLSDREIKAIDAEHCAGIWRNWVELIRKCRYYMLRLGLTVLSMEIVAAALASKTGKG